MDADQLDTMPPLEDEQDTSAATVGADSGAVPAPAVVEVDPTVAEGTLAPNDPPNLTRSGFGA